jgi:hypothetical protein
MCCSWGEGVRVLKLGQRRSCVVVGVKAFVC